MGLFKSPRGKQPEPPEPDDPIPVTTFDLSKRYDLYCSTPSEDRLYENVKIIGIRTFEKKKHNFGAALIGGYLDLETDNGARMMIPHTRLYMICEHGSRPDYKVLRIRKADHEA